MSEQKNNFAEAILGVVRTGNPKEIITAPPLAGPGSGVAPANLPSNITNKPAPPYGPNEQDTNDLAPVTVIIVPETGFENAFDFKVMLPGPCKRIMLSSIGPTEDFYASGIWISLKPTGIAPPATPTYVPTGSEGWIELQSSVNTNAIFLQGTIIEFRKPVTYFYVSVSNGSGSFTPANPMFITFIKADDICGIEWRPAADTQG